MAHPSSPTRHLVDQNTVQKKFAPKAHCTAIGLGDSKFAETIHIVASHTVCRYHKQKTTEKISL